MFYLIKPLRWFNELSGRGDEAHTALPGTTEYWSTYQSLLSSYSVFRKNGKYFWVRSGDSYARECKSLEDGMTQSERHWVSLLDKELDAVDTNWCQKRLPRETI